MQQTVVITELVLNSEKFNRITTCWQTYQQYETSHPLGRHNCPPF